MDHGLWRRRAAVGRAFGYIAFGLSLLGLGAVLCFHFPYYLTTRSLRAIYPMDLIRGLLAFGLGFALVLGILSFLLNPKKYYGLVGFGVAVLATLAGGSEVKVLSPVPPAKFVALDFLILDLLLVTILFVPMERFFARIKEQKVLRPGWKIDLKHYCVNHLLSSVTILLITTPALFLGQWLSLPSLKHWVSSQPLICQIFVAMLAADAFQYWIHRAFHQIPWLWRFHAVHHSSEAMDWLAGSRLHIVDVVITRAVSFVPLYLMGITGTALHVYLVIVAYQSVFIHSNTKFRFKGLRWLVATPAFHHWHHSSEQGSLNKNFAISLPILDLVFGTFYLPRGEWPKQYGTAGESVPDGYLKQVLYPFVRRSK